MTRMLGKRAVVSLYLDPEVFDALKALAGATRVPAAVYLREAVDDLLKKYRRKVGRVAK